MKFDYYALEKAPSLFICVLVYANRQSCSLQPGGQGPAAPWAPAAPRAPALLKERSPPAGLVIHRSALSFPVLLQPAHRPGETHWGTE